MPPDPQTVDAHVKAIMGDLLVQLAIARAENDVLREQLARLVVTGPPERTP